MSLFEQIEKNLKNLSENIELHSNRNNFEAQVDLKKLKQALIVLRHECGFIQLVDMFAQDLYESGQDDRKFKVTYILFNFEKNARIFIDTTIQRHEVMPTVGDVWCNSAWCEREIFDLFGITFSKSRSEDHRRLFYPESFVGHALLKDYLPKFFELDEEQEHPFRSHLYLSQKDMSERTIVSLGPQLNNNRGSFRVWFEMEDEIICRASTELGFIHRGIEKMAEMRNIFQMLNVTERLNYLNPSIGSLLWCKTVEDLMNVDVPERAKALRMGLLEIARIIDHARSTLSILNTIQLSVGTHEFGEIVKSGEKLLQSFTGQQYFHHLCVVGGLSKNIPPHWMGELMDWIRFVERLAFAGKQALISSPFWINHVRSKGINASEAIEWGFSGPILRSCGVNFDLRKAEPFYFYQDVDFEIPLGIDGTGYDQFLVKMEEIKQSLNILAQVADNLPVGDYLADDPRVTIGKVSKIQEGDEAQMARIQRILSIGATLPAKRRYSSIEAPQGEMGLTLIGNNTAHPARTKWRTPSFYHLQPFSKWSIGMKLTEAKTFLETFNVNISEIDR